MQTWSQDTPTGPFRNNFLSEQLYEASFEKAEVIQWVEPVDGFGKKKGDTVNLFTMTGPPESPTKGILQENIRIPETAVGITGTSFLILEFGEAVTWTNIWDDFAKYDLPAFVKKRLREIMKLTLDVSAGDGFKKGLITMTPSSASGFRNDTLFKEWYVLGNPEKLQRGEIGMVENIRIIETNHDTVLQVTTSAGTNIGQAFIFGDEAVAFAEAQTPELRLKIADDYGRNLGCAWYGQLGFGLYHPTANPREARVLRIAGNNCANP